MFKLKPALLLWPTSMIGWRTQTNTDEWWLVLIFSKSIEPISGAGSNLFKGSLHFLAESSSNAPHQIHVRLHQCLIHRWFFRSLFPSLTFLLLLRIEYEWRSNCWWQNNIYCFCLLLRLVSTFSSIEFLTWHILTFCVFHWHSCANILLHLRSEREREKKRFRHMYGST